jgi:hypothetical protein
LDGSAIFEVESHVSFFDIASFVHDRTRSNIPSATTGLFSPSSALLMGNTGLFSPPTELLEQTAPLRTPTPADGQDGVSVGVIVGSAVGGVVLVAAAIGFLIWRRRKRNWNLWQTEQSSSEPPEAPPETIIDATRDTLLMSMLGDLEGRHVPSGQKSSSKVDRIWDFSDDDAT